MKVGDVVYCIYKGIGRIIAIRTNDSYPYEVQFDNGERGTYTEDGKIVYGSVNTCLFTQIRKEENNESK